MTSEQWLKTHGFEHCPDGDYWKHGRWQAYEHNGVWYAHDTWSTFSSVAGTAQYAFSGLRTQLLGWLAELPQ